MNMGWKRLFSNRNSLSQFGLVLFLLPFFAVPANAEGQKYITDNLEVTMRSGTSTANSIVRILKSGQAVTILEEDLASQYSLVETDDGKKGYVLSRFLDEIPSARQRLEQLQQKSQKQIETISSLGEEIQQLKTELNNEQTDNESLKGTLLASENELTKIRTASENTLSILEDNERLKSIVAELRKDKQNLSDENDSLKDSTKMDWFIRGAAVSLIAFLLGIIITRIRWRKQDAWGSY